MHGMRWYLPVLCCPGIFGPPPLRTKLIRGHKPFLFYLDDFFVCYPIKNSLSCAMDENGFDPHSVGRNAHTFATISCGCGAESL